MDTSKEYIKMCQEAKDLQRSWLSRTGDYLFDSRLKSPSVSIYVSELDKYVEGFGQRFDVGILIWLPRQDQLQDMSDNISDKGLFFWSLSNCAEGWLCVGRDIAEQMIYPREERYLIGEDYSETAEQALLKMYIGIGCNKTWNGKGWIDDRTKVI